MSLWCNLVCGWGCGLLFGRRGLVLILVVLGERAQGTQDDEHLSCETDSMTPVTRRLHEISFTRAPVRSLVLRTRVHQLVDIGDLGMTDVTCMPGQ